MSPVRMNVTEEEKKKIACDIVDLLHGLELETCTELLAIVFGAILAGLPEQRGQDLREAFSTVADNIDRLNRANPNLPPSAVSKDAFEAIERAVVGGATLTPGSDKVN